MDSAYVVYIGVLLAFSWVVLAALGSLPLEGATAGKRTPPGPRPLPLLGNLLQLSNQPHRTLAGLARIHGPLMFLRLGRLPVVVVSSPSVAKQVLHTHDHALSSRDEGAALRGLDCTEQSTVMMPPGDARRHLRRLCNTHLFTLRRLEAHQGIRSLKVRELVIFVETCSRSGCAVDVGRLAFTATLNVLSSTLFSADVVGHDSESSAEFKNLIRGVMEEAGGPNIGDYFPLVRWADLQGRRRRMTRYLERLQKLFDDMIDERLKSRSVKARADAEDVLDVLLDALASSELDRRTINSLLTDLFAAGSDTSSATVEWAMAELLHNPRAMAKALSELEEVMKGSGRGAVEESNINRLPYLQAVVKETLRRHPPAPFLVSMIFLLLEKYFL